MIRIKFVWLKKAVRADHNRLVTVIENGGCDVAGFEPVDTALDPVTHQPYASIWKRNL